MRSDLQRLKRDTDTNGKPIPATEPEAVTGARIFGFKSLTATGREKAAVAALRPKNQTGKSPSLVAVIAVAIIALLFWQIETSHIA